MGNLQPINNIVPFAGGALKFFSHYEAAKHELEQSVSLIAVEQVRCQVSAIEALAKIAKDLSLEINAVKLRTDAERRLGQLIVAAKQSGELARHGGARGKGQVTDTDTCSGQVTDTDTCSGQVTDTDTCSVAPSLADIGLSRKEADRAQKYAALSDEQFAEQQKQLEEKAEKTGRVPKHLPCAAEKPRKKAPIIEQKEDAIEADFQDADMDDLADDSFQSLYEQEAQHALQLSEENEQLKEAIKALEERVAAFEADSKAAVNDELARENVALKHENEALARDNKALLTQRDHFQNNAATLQKSLNWYREEYKKVCKATGYERERKTSTYCTGSGYSDENDPRHIDWLKQKEQEAQLAKEKAACNQQKMQANQWLAGNNLPADDGYIFNGKQAVAQATREKFADNRPKPAPVDVAPAPVPTPAPAPVSTPAPVKKEPTFDELYSADIATVVPSAEALRREAEGILDMNTYKRARLAGATEMGCIRVARIWK